MRCRTAHVNRIFEAIQNGFCRAIIWLLYINRWRRIIKFRTSNVSMYLSYTSRLYIMYSHILKAYLLFSLDTLNHFGFALISAISMVEDACYMKELVNTLFIEIQDKIFLPELPRWVVGNGNINCCPTKFWYIFAQFVHIRAN
jgi:hypothetical protein